MIDLYEWKDGCSYDIKHTIYIVRKGDNYKNIIKKFNVSLEELKKYNNINDLEKLIPGQKIIIDNSNKPT